MIDLKHLPADFALRDLQLYQGARLLSTLAEHMISVAVGWQIYEQSGRAFDLGLVGLVQFVPSLGFSLLSGHTTDRFDRRTIVVLGYGALAFASGLLIVASHTSAVTWPLYATLFLIATVRAFLGPAQQAFLPDLVATEGLASAVAWGSSVGEIGAILGPALGGWVYSMGQAGAPIAGVGGRSVYLAALAAYLVAAFLTAAMTERGSPQKSEAVSFKTVLAGVVYVWRNKILLGSISLDLFAVLFGGAVALLPIFARDVLHTGPWALGLLRSAPAVGAVLMAMVLAVRPLQRRTGLVLLASVAVFGAATIAFGASRSLWLSLLALVIIGASDMVSVVLRSTLVQVATPAEMRGRVSAVNMVFIGASSELGALESGMAAAWLGTIPSVLFGGAAACVVVAAYALLFPALRRVDRLDLAAPAE